MNQNRESSVFQQIKSQPKEILTSPGTDILPCDANCAVEHKLEIRLLSTAQGSSINCNTGLHSIDCGSIKCYNLRASAYAGSKDKYLKGNHVI